MFVVFWVPTFVLRVLCEKGYVYKESDLLARKYTGGYRLITNSRDLLKSLTFSFLVSDIYNRGGKPLTMVKKVNYFCIRCFIT